MISKTVLKQSIKTNYKIWLAITIVVSLFMVMIFAAFNLRSADATDDNPFTFTILSLLTTSFYGMIAVILPMIYSIFVGNRLVAKEVDSGIMSCTLNTPITRTKLILTKAFYLVCSIILMMVVLTITGLIMDSILSTDLDIGTFLLINLGLTIYSLAVSGIVFLSSSIFNKSSSAMGLGAGLPLLFYVLSLVSTLDDSFEFLKYFSLNTLFDTTNIVAGSNYVLQFIAMFAISVITYTASVIYFKKKDLPI